jgi:hypothetical protein
MQQVYDIVQGWQEATVDECTSMPGDDHLALSAVENSTMQGGSTRVSRRAAPCHA